MSGFFNNDLICIGDPADPKSYVHIYPDPIAEYQYGEMENECYNEIMIEPIFVGKENKNKKYHSLQITDEEWKTLIFFAEKRIRRTRSNNQYQINFINEVIKLCKDNMVRKYAKSENLNWKMARIAIEHYGIILLIENYMREQLGDLSANSSNLIRKSIEQNLNIDLLAYDKTARVRNVLVSIILCEKNTYDYEIDKSIGKILSCIRLYYSLKELTNINVEDYQKLHEKSLYTTKNKKAD